MARRAFKSDTSFLEKISMGAIGTQRVFADAKAQGHTPIELERGSMTFKIWKKIKIKRIRVPDLLCVACARRIESRAKTAIEITMSHSMSDPERGWDHGLVDGDSVALVGCHRVGEGPTDWQADDLVQYLAVKDLRAAQTSGQALLVKPKGAEEGFEARITWPAAVAKTAGTVADVSDKRIQIRRVGDGRAVTLSLNRGGLHVEPRVQKGETVENGQIVAAVVPVVHEFLCPKSVSWPHYVDRLNSTALSERYAAVKALPLFAAPEIDTALAGRMGDPAEHIFVRIEAAAGLARHARTEAWAFIEGCLADPYLQHRLEAVITLAEIKSPRSAKLLCKVLADEAQDAEIRGGAAWALGELGDQASLEALIATFSGVDEGIRTEAARALAKLASRFSGELLAKLPNATRTERPGLAWALSRGGKFKAQDVLACLVDEDARQWTAYALGMQDQQRFIADMEAVRERDPEVFFAVTLLWKIVTSWVYTLDEHG
jgi:HEAT repeat protein